MRIAEEVREACPDVPLICFPKGCPHALEPLSHAPYDVLGVDWVVDPAEAIRLTGGRVALQGNLDPCALYGGEAVIRTEVARMLRDLRCNSGGYIANLGHGMHPTHCPEQVQWFIDAVREETARIDSEAAV